MLGYLQTFWEQFNWSTLLDAVMRMAGILLCLTVHETCHGLAALVLGDPTAKRQNRLSLNPLKHIDWLGLAAMFICGFGWAKPVQVDMRSFKNPRRGMALTALAGPISNFLLAAVSIAISKVISLYAPYTPMWSGIFEFCIYDIALLSIGLGLFNLIPIPPLDGSKVLAAVLPDRTYIRLMRVERYGIILLLILSYFGFADGFITRGISAVFGVLVNIFY